MVKTVQSEPYHSPITEISAQGPDQHPVINAVCPTNSLFGGWVSGQKDLLYHKMFMNTLQGQMW